MQIISQFVPLPLADPAQGTPQPKARKPRGRGGKIALRAALIVLAVIIAAGAIGMVLVAKKDTIFPLSLIHI